MNAKTIAFAGAAALIFTPLSSSWAQVVQSEPNDSIGTATPSTLVAGSAGGVLSVGNNGDGPHGPTSGDSTGDFDFFSIPSLAGQVIVFDINSNILGTGVDSVAGLYGPTGVLVASNDDDGDSRDSFIRYVVPADGNYFGVVGNWVTGRAEDNLPTDPNTAGSGRGAPGGAVDEYEVVILLDGAAYLTNGVPDFPLIGVDEQSEGGVVLTNQGLDAVTITGVEFSGAGAGGFSTSASLPLTIGAGGSTTLPVTFDPGGSGDSFAATLEITSNDIVHPTFEIPLNAKAVDGLLFHLPFDDPAGSSTGAFGVPAEASGSGLPAAMIVNAGAPQPVFGRPSLFGGEGFSTMFNDAGSSGNFVLTGNNFPHTATFTYSLWVRPTAGSGQDTLFNRDPNFGLSDAIYGCTIGEDGSVSFRISGADVVTSAGGAVPDDEIHHIVVSHFDSGGFGDFMADRTRLYIDGVMVAENTATFEVPEYFGGGNTRLWIGTRSAAGTGFNGDMDDFQLYITELSADDVTELFENPGTVLGTAPRAPLAVTDVSLSEDGGSVSVTWNSRSGRNYTVESSVDLGASEWVELDDSIPSEGESTSYTTPITLGQTRLYIRVKES